MSSPPTWSSLILPVKQIIVEKLDYSDRCNLKLCSQSDKLLVESVKFTPEFIQFEKRFEDIVLTFENVEKRFSNAQVEDAQKFIEDKWSRNGVVEARTVKLLNIPLTPYWTLKCANLELRMLGATLTDAWLKKTIPKLRTLEIMDKRIDASILDLEQVRTCSDFVRLSRDVMIDDRQLELLRAPSLVLITNTTSSNDSFLTENGVKKAFKKYIENCCTTRRNQEFQIKYPKRNGMDHRNLFDKSWIIEKVEEESEEGAARYFIYNITGGISNVNGIKEFLQVIIFEFEDRFILKVH